MRKYRVMIHGQNLLTEIDGIQRRAGFYTNVFVEAFTPADAEERAIDILREDAHLCDIALNGKTDALRFSADEVHEIESFEGERLPRQGLVFYEEKLMKPFQGFCRSLPRPRVARSSQPWAERFESLQDSPPLTNRRKRPS